MIKRRKIENNRAKRKLNEQKPTRSPVSSETNETNTDAYELDDEGGASGQEGLGETAASAAADSSGYDAYAGNYDSRSSGSFDSNHVAASTSTSANANKSSAATAIDYMVDVNPELMTGEEMVEFIVRDPDRASQAISKLMRSPAEALSSLEKIINSQKDALCLISHLINYPGK